MTKSIEAQTAATKALMDAHIKQCEERELRSNEQRAEMKLTIKEVSEKVDDINSIVNNVQKDMATVIAKLDTLGKSKNPWGLAITPKSLSAILGVLVTGIGGIITLFVSGTLTFN